MAIVAKSETDNSDKLSPIRLKTFNFFEVNFAEKDQKTLVQNILVYIKL